MAISQFKRERLMKKLHEQVMFVERSSQAFDNGLEDEAIRIALSLRVIFHDKGVSKSLISRLGFAGKRMVSSAPLDGRWMNFLSQQINLSLPQPVRMVPLLGNKFREVTIQDWWHIEPVFTYQNEVFPRKRIILSAAEKDGGAHVDDRLEKYYESLCAGEHGIGIIGNNLRFADGGPTFPQGMTIFARNTHLALIRQFAHEVLSAVTHFKWLS